MDLPEFQQPTGDLLPATADAAKQWNGRHKILVDILYDPFPVNFDNTEVNPSPHDNAMAIGERHKPYHAKTAPLIV